MPARKAKTAPAPTSKRVTRSATAKNPTAEFAVLAPPTRKRSNSATPSTSGTDTRKPSSRATTVGNTTRAGPSGLPPKTKGRSLREYLTIDLPTAIAAQEEAARAQEAAEAAAHEAATASTMAEGQGLGTQKSFESATTVAPTSPPMAPNDAPSSPPAAADSSSTPSRSSWGLSSIYNSVKRVVLSPFPPSKKLATFAALPLSPSSGVKPSELTPITEELSPAKIDKLDKIQQTPAALAGSRKLKRRLSTTRRDIPKKLRITEPESPAPAHPETPSRPVRNRSPVKEPKTPVRTPNRRSSRAIRESRRTPARADPTPATPAGNSGTPAAHDTLMRTAPPFVIPSPADTIIADPTPAATMRYNTFTVPEGSLSPEESEFPDGLLGNSRTSDGAASKTARVDTPAENSSLAVTATPSRKFTPMSVDPSTETTKKRKRVMIDDLDHIPSRRPGQSSGTFALLDEFFDADQDSIELDETELELCMDRPAKKVRLENNVFEMTAPKPASSKPASATPAGSPPKQPGSYLSNTADGLPPPPQHVSITPTGSPPVYHAVWTPSGWQHTLEPNPRWTPAGEPSKQGLGLSTTPAGSPPAQEPPFTTMPSDHPGYYLMWVPRGWYYSMANAGVPMRVIQHNPPVSGSPSAENAATTPAGSPASSEIDFGKSPVPGANKYQIERTPGGWHLIYKDIPESHTPAGSPPKQDASTTPNGSPPAHANPALDSGAPDALQRKRSEAEKYKPTRGSRLREMQRLSSLSTVATSSLHGSAPIAEEESLFVEANSPLRASTFEGFTEVYDNEATTSAVPDMTRDHTASPTTSPPGSPPARETSFDPKILPDASPLQLEPAATTQTSRTGGGVVEFVWDFPQGESLQDFFSQDEIEWAKAHPPSKAEVEETTSKLRADYEAFVAAGGADKPLSYYLNL